MDSVEFEHSTWISVIMNLFLIDKELPNFIPDKVLYQQKPRVSSLLVTYR